jgi:uncharacterized membrane protein YeaQ/YmgE (transglycosylase-associated protein family)
MGQYLAEYHWAMWILIGLIAGWIAKKIVPGREPGGCIVTIAIGVAGAVLAGYLGQRLDWYDPGEGAGFLAAIVGAVVLLALYQVIVRISGR